VAELGEVWHKAPVARERNRHQQRESIPVGDAYTILFEGLARYDFRASQIVRMHLERREF
jgi:hypothetical protein